MKLPLLHIDLPRDVTALHQIEITSRCSLACFYCPWPSMPRPKLDMDGLTFVRALEWVRHFVHETRTQRELNLAGIGESLIHPDFVEYLCAAREACGPEVRIIFATNGVYPQFKVAKDDAKGYYDACRAYAEQMRPYKPVVWVSLHRPERAAIAANAFRDAGLLEGMSADPTLNAMDWSGQVKWFNSARAGQLPCQWLREGKVMAMADGRLTTCCYDASGVGVVGHVRDPIGTVKVQPYSLCGTCDQVIGVAGHDQFAKEAPHE